MSRARIAAMSISMLVAASRADADDFLSRLTLHQTLDSKYVAKPAVIHFIRNKDKPNSWDVNLGAKLNLAFGTLGEYAEFGPAIDYQRNTVIEKELDQLKAGLNADIDLGTLANQSVVPIVSMSAQFVRDGVKNTKGIGAKGKASLIVRGGASPVEDWYRPNRYANLGAIGLKWSPFVGLEYEDALDAEMATDEGDIGRFVAQGILTLYPAPACLEKKLEIIVDGSWRRDLFGSLRTDDRNHLYVSASVNLYFLKQESPDRALGIGIDYVRGEDPDQKFADQDFWRFGAKGLF